MQIKNSLPTCNDGRKGGMALSMGGKLVIELSLKFVFHYAGFRTRIIRRIPASVICIPLRMASISSGVLILRIAQTSG